MRPSPGRVLALSISLSVGLLLGAAGCGSGEPVCGNGLVEGNEQCDRGEQNGQPGIACNATCKSISIPIPQLQVAWGLLKQTGVTAYRGAGCAAFGAASAKIEVTGAFPLSLTAPCLDYGHLFTNQCLDTATCNKSLPAGDYSASVTLLDAQGQPLTDTVTTGPLAAKAGSITNLLVDFGMDDFLRQDWTGSFQLRASWGADNVRCADAAPPVEQESLRLVQKGKMTPVMARTTPLPGTPLDGTPAGCYTPTSGYPAEEAKDLPWGPYTLTVQGLAAGSAAAYCGRFEIFIGPGSNNQQWQLTIPAVAGGADGGVTCP